MPRIGSLIIGIGADVKGVLSSIQTIEGAINKFSRNFGSLGKGLAGTFAAAEIVNFGKQALIASAKYETAFLQIKNLTDTSAADLGRFNTRVRELSNVVGIPSLELAKGLYTVTSAGALGEQALQNLEIAAKASALGMGETNSIARTLTGVINAYGKENLSAARTAEILFKTVKLGAIDVGELTGVISNVTPLAAQLGVTMEEVGAFLSTVSLNGTNAGEAVTQLRSLLDAIINPSEQAAKLLKQMGISSNELQQVIREKGLREALLLLKEGFNGNNEALSKFTGRKEATIGFLSVMGQQLGRYGEILEETKLKTNGFEKATVEALNSSEARWKRFTTSLSNIGLEIGDVLKKAVLAITDQGVFRPFFKQFEVAKENAEGLLNVFKVKDDVFKLKIPEKASIDIPGSIKFDVPTGLEEIPGKIKNAIETASNKLAASGNAFKLPQIKALDSKSTFDNLDDDKKLRERERLEAEREKRHEEWLKRVKVAYVALQIPDIKDSYLSQLDRVKDSVGELSEVFERFKRLADFSSFNDAGGGFGGFAVKPVQQGNEKESGDIGKQIEQLNALGGAMAQFSPATDLATESQKEFNAALEYTNSLLAATVEYAADSFGQLAANVLLGEVALKDFGQAAVQAANQVVKAALAESIASVIKWLVGKLGPIGIPIAAAAALGVSSLFKSKVPKLAKGGIAYGPQLALVGDNPNARQDPEVISPLSKLKVLLSAEVLKIGKILSTALDKSLSSIDISEQLKAREDVKINIPNVEGIIRSIRSQKIQIQIPELDLSGFVPKLNPATVLDLQPAALDVNVTGRIAGNDIQLLNDRLSANTNLIKGRKYNY